MSKNVEHLMNEIKYALSIRPKVGGFPVLAEVMRKAGVQHNFWQLPSCQSIYVMKEGSVVIQNANLVSGPNDIAKFDREALIKALRKDQAGLGTFPEFLQSAWEAGVISYDVDLNNRKVTYYGVQEESYIEEYPAVEVKR